MESTLRLKIPLKAFLVWLFHIMYQSIPSLTIPPGNFFDGRIPHPLGKKEFKTPSPRAFKKEL